MMKNIRETLAGRIGILELYGLSKNEIEGITFPNELDFSLPCLIERQKLAARNNIVDVFEHIWRGGMPQVLRGRRGLGRNTTIPMWTPTLCGMWPTLAVSPILCVSENS